MIKRKILYKDQKIRFIILPDNGVLLNTSDICKVIGVEKQERYGELTEPEIDKASAVIATLAVGNDEALDFVDWLVETFINFNDGTLVRPSGNDLWNFE